MKPDSSSLSIGYLSPGWPLAAFANGIVSYIADMSDELSKLGHQVTNLANRIVGDELDPRLYDVRQADSIRSPARRVMDSLNYRIAPRWANRHSHARRVLITLQRAIGERKLQIFEMEESFGLSTLVQSAVTIPVCLRLHGPWFLNGSAVGAREDHVFRRRVAQEGHAIASAVALTSSSRDVLEQTRSYYNVALRDAEVIYPPAPPTCFADRWRLDACDPRQVLFIGRFDRHKGGDLIIEAFGRVFRQIPEARLCFVGPDRGITDTQGRQWNIEQFVHDRLPGKLESGQVTLLGEQSFTNLDSLRRKAMLTVVCSRYENAPRALIEAMSLACPVVAARVGGIPEILENQVDGLLHTPGDPDDLAAQIIAMLSNPGRAADLGRHAAEACERRFCPETIATQMVDFYRWAIPRRKIS